MTTKKKISNSFLIGIFILLGLSLLVGFLLWLGATQFLKDYNYYVTYFEESVDGLGSGSSIKYLGVSCGFVDEINIATDGKLVEIVLKLDKNLSVNETFVARLESAGLAGGKYIQLTSEKDIPRELKLDFTPPYQIINSAPSQLLEMAQSAESIIAHLNKIRWQEISDELVGTLKGTNKLVRDLEVVGVVSDVKTITQSLNLILSQLSTTSIPKNLENTFISINNSAKSLESFSMKLDSKADSIDIHIYLNKMYDDFHNTLTSVNTAVDALSSRLQSSILGINILLEDISKTNKNLNKTLRTINESPYMFLTEPPPSDDVK